MSPRRVNREGRQRQILAKAADLFAERGYDGVSMRQVARALRCSTGALYHFFPSKEALFRGCVRQAAEEEMAEARVVAGDHDEPSRQIAALAQHYLSKGEQHRRLVMLMLAAAQSRSRKVHMAIVSDALQARVSWLRDIFERANQREELRAADALVAARVFVALINGLGLEAYAGGEPLDEAVRKEVISFLLKAFEPRRA